MMEEDTPKAETDGDKVLLSFRFEQYSFSEEEAKDLGQELIDAADNLE